MGLQQHDCLVPQLVVCLNRKRDSHIPPKPNRHFQLALQIQLALQHLGQQPVAAYVWLCCYGLVFGCAVMDCALAVYCVLCTVQCALAGTVHQLCSQAAHCCASPALRLDPVQNLPFGIL